MAAVRGRGGVTGLCGDWSDWDGLDWKGREGRKERTCSGSSSSSPSSTGLNIHFATVLLLMPSSMAASKTEARRTVSESRFLALGRGLGMSIEGEGEDLRRWECLTAVVGKNE